MSVVVNDLKVTFFKKYGITPTVKTVKGGTVEIYPDITAEKLIQLIAIASGVFRVVFAFERGYADVEQNVLESLINMTIYNVVLERKYNNFLENLVLKFQKQ